MKKVKNFLTTLLPSFFVLGMCIPLFLNGAPSTKVEDPGEDTAIYDNDLTHARLDRPDIRKAPGEDDEDEEEVVEVDKVILHYYNEAGGNKGRAFYLWVTGEDGVEYSLDNASDIMTVSDDDTMMDIIIDFSTPRFKAYAGKSSMYFIIKFKKISDSNLNWGGQSDDVQLRYADFPPQGDDKVCEVWTMPAAGGGIAVLDSEAKTKVHGVKLARFTDWKTIKCELTENTNTVNWKLYAYDETYYKIKPKKRANSQKWYLVKSGTNSGNFDIKLDYEAHINMVYSLVSHDPESDSDPDMKELDKTAVVSFEKLYNHAKFHTYYEDGVKAKLAEDGVKQLGMTYTPEGTTFKVWSPVSANMTVLIYDKDTSAEYAPADATDKDKYDKYNGYHMHYTSGGVWELTIDGDLKGKYYNYQVDNTLGTNVVMDPYATSAGCCGVRGYIYDKADTNPEGWDALPLRWDSDIDNPNKNTTRPELNLKTPQDLTIYEVHVQDLTGDKASWISKHNNKNGTYNAFVESGTTYTEDGVTVKTGYDHLDELGVSAVQLVPVFDHDNDESADELKYNWGYNPLNYNIVEGGYSSDPHNGLARVQEFKNLVLRMSETEANTRVIMDVVYNHVSSATGSNFHKLMPRYYFRYAEMDYYNEYGYKYQTKDELWDGSGCHNEVATERPMMRKFIVDSLKMWATEYKIKGFRFDLMGLIDFKTMQEAQKELYKIDPDIYIYGEGWSLGYHGEGSDQWKAAHQGEADPGNFGTNTWQVYNECNRFTVGDESVYLGGFNDCFRDAMRGGNGSQQSDGKTYPGSGFVQNGVWVNGGKDYGTLDKVADGLWGANSNVTSGQDHHKTGFYPEQTINYVSCHDNWTVRDQLFNTLPKSGDNTPPTLQSILRASLQAHAMVMASNSAAFILGGEELLRTKEYVPDPTKEDGNDPDKISGITVDSWTLLFGHKISHNSYNAPISVNSFKWGNKIKVTCGDDEITNAEFDYIGAFKTLIKSHKGLEKKRGVNVSYGEYMSTTSSGQNVINNYWGRVGDKDNLSNAIAFQANEAYILICVGDLSGGNNYIGALDGLTNWTSICDYGPHTYNEGTVSFSGPTNAYWLLNGHINQEGRNDEEK